MPIYEFECQGCSRKFEKLCSISSGGNGVTCPDCDSIEVKRLISGFFARTSSGGSSCSCGGSCGGCSKSSCAGCHH